MNFPEMNDFVLARYSVDNMVYRARVEMIEQQIVTASIYPFKIKIFMV